MATEEFKGTRYSCDAECGTTRIVDQGGTPPDGFHGPLLEMWSQGERVVTAASFWACRPGCVRKAIENVTARERTDTSATEPEQENPNG
jgi:hypothetical protein